MSQQISVIGQIATEPKLFSPERGVQFCTFRLACTERRFDSQKGEWVDAETNWFTINAFRTLAAHSKESFAKGDRVIVNGRLRVRSWEKDEKRGTSVEIDIDGIGHDVRWGVSSFAKRQGGSVASEEANADPQPAASDAPSGQSMGAWAEPSEASAEVSEALSSDGFTPAEAAA